MRLPADRQSCQLPKSFPIGARYVVEGRGGEDGHLRVFSRYVVLPGGRRIKLPTKLGQLPGLSPPASRHSRAQSRANPSHSSVKKIIGRGGTTQQQRN
jgi:hypothetical protein